MRPTGNLRGIACGVLALTLCGCGGARSAKAVRPLPAPPAPAPLTPPPPGPVFESRPPLPPASLGPRGGTTEAPGAPSPGPPAERRPTPAPPIAPPVPAAQRGRFVVLNFDNADVETVVHAASEILGFNYVLAPDVRGKVTVQTSGRIPQEDVFNLLLAILEVHGFTAVRSENLYKIVRIPDAATRGVPTIVGTAPDPARASEEVITQIVPVHYTSVNDLKTLLQPLVSQQRGSVIAHRETNVLIITDIASNIRRLLDIVRLVDVQVALEETQIIPLQYADAADLAQILNQLFASGRLRPGVGVGAPAPTPPTPGGGGGDSATERPPLILAERRANALVVNARRNEMDTIRKLVARLDINITGGRRIFIYYAENAKAKDMAATMNAIYGGAPTGTGRAGEALGPPPGSPVYGGPTRVTPPPPAPTTPGTGEATFVEGQFRFIGDETTNAVIVATFPRYWTDFEQTLKQLDRSPRQVLIEVLVAEVTLTGDMRLGIEWAVRSGKFDVSSAPGLGSNPAGTLQGRPSYRIPTAAAAGSTGAITTLAGLNVFTFATDQFFSAINTFASEDLLNVLSSPSIMTSENKKAVINVSTSIPIVTSQQVPIGGAVATGTTTTAVVGTQSVEYRDAGVVLTVTPRIGERGTVALDVKQEVNDIGNQFFGTTGSPTIIKREAETSVVLLNNQTLVLGGLIKDKRDRTTRGIPVLKDIPVLGYLFGTKVNTVDKTELLILITPRVIGTALDAARVTESMRKATPQFDKTFEEVPALPPTGPGSTAPTVPAPQAPRAPEAPAIPPPPSIAPPPAPTSPPAR